MNVPLVPEPLSVVPPGLTVTVQEPDAGKPFITTDPVDTVQVGSVIVPIKGAFGVTGAEFKMAFVEDAEVQPRSFVTVNE